jgi:hypothetical protein
MLTAIASCAPAVFARSQFLECAFQPKLEFADTVPQELDILAMPLAIATDNCAHLCNLHCAKVRFTECP